MTLEEEGLTVVGRYGTAVLSARAPADVRERVLAALGGAVQGEDEGACAMPDDADAPSAGSADEQTAKRPDGTGLVKTGVWVDPDYAPLPETGVWAEAADETAVAPFPPVDIPRHPEPAPGSGLRRRRRERTTTPDADVTAQSMRRTPDAAVASAGSPPEAPPPPAPEGATAAAGTIADKTDADVTGRGDYGIVVDAVTQATGDATQALTEAAAPPPPEAPVPLLSAAMCAAGHPNPPDAVSCQVCAAPLTGEIRQVPRPVLAVLTLSTGQTVPVRGDVVIGRAPHARTGAEATTQLVAVPSPTHFVSRSHLEISVAGWNLLARDLGSANGTVLVRSGTPPVLLASALPTPLYVGDMLDVGDGVNLRVEPPV